MVAPENPDEPSAPAPGRRRPTRTLALLVIGALVLGGICVWQARERPRLLVASGIAMLGEGRYGDAIAMFREAIRLRPDYAEAHTNLGLALVMQQKPSEAVTALREAIRLNPGDASAHFTLGKALRQLDSQRGRGRENLDEVISEYREAIRLEPGFARAFHALGRVLSEQGRFEEAIGAYHDAIRRQVEGESIYYDLLDAERARENAARATPH